MRGQVIVTDLAISILIGLTMVLFVQSRFIALPASPEEEAFIISEQLVSSRGVPEDWDNETVVSLGLAKTRGDLDAKKLEELAKLSPQRLRHLFNSRYGVTVTLDNRTLVFSGSGKENYRFFRHVSVEGEPQVLGVVLSEG